MGVKHSKEADLFVTDEFTQSGLPIEAIRKYDGSPCEYAAVDVCLDMHSKDGRIKANSISKVLSDASKKNFKLCFLTSLKDNPTLNFGRKMIWNEINERRYLASHNITAPTHTVVLSRDKLSPEVQR